MEVMALLQSRNRCLQRFLKITLEFLESVDRGDFDGLECFLTSRDKIVRVLELYDRKLTETIHSISSPEKRRTIAAEIPVAMAARDQLIRDIFLTDREITNRIDAKKLKIAEQMGSTRKTRQSMNKFKSGWVAEPGEGIDTKL